MSNHLSQKDLESYLWGAAVLLRGTIDAGDYKQFIFPLLFFKRICDVYDEEFAEALAENGDESAGCEEISTGRWTLSATRPSSDPSSGSPSASISATSSSRANWTRKSFCETS